MQSPEEREEIGALHARVVDAEQAVRMATSLDALLRLERDLLRPLAQLLRRHTLRYRIQVVRCPWPPLQAAANACAVIAGSGQGELHAALDEAGLRPCMPQPGQAPEADLWRQIAEAELLLVDLRASERDSLWARICYGVGLAMAIGRVVVVCRDDGAALPFDLDTVSFVRGRAGPTLADTVCTALCQVPSLPRDPAAVLSAAAHAVQADPPTAPRAWHTAGRLQQRVSAPEVDPIAIRRAIDSHLARVGGPFRTELSAFQPAYPRQGALRCFHVLPFRRPEWVTSAVRDACGPDVRYLRGDTEADLQVMQRIWTGIGESSLVVVDLTDLTPNVCLELGVARTLGRPLVLCHERSSWDEHRLFAEIARLSVHRYDSARELTQAVRPAVDAIRAVPGS